MLQAEKNERLTRVGPGTPAGELLRRYWYPIAAISELDAEPVKKVRLLGEDLALYRDRSGKLGLIAELCPHRRASLAYGMPEENGLRCPYHGWLFDSDGSCVEQPAEPDDSTFKSRIRTAAYRVEELGGLIFAYLGPDPAPLLPRFDLFVMDGVMRSVGRAEVPCNWLQIMENSVDATHVEWLHGKYFRYVLDKKEPGAGAKVAGFAQRHVKIGFDVFEWGIIKRRVLEGGTEEDDDWAIGHPLVFPHILRVGRNLRHTFQIRVPVDDTTTMHWWYQVYMPDEGVEVPPQAPFEVYDVPFREENGQYIVDFVDGQDIMCWVTQGEIANRSLEHLGTSDKGIILLRNLLSEQIDKVERGEDPMGVVRDPAVNHMIELPQERDKFNMGLGRIRTSLGSDRYDPKREAILDLVEGVQKQDA